MPLEIEAVEALAAEEEEVEVEVEVRDAVEEEENILEDV